jgi:hypothetical protein
VSVRESLCVCVFFLSESDCVRKIFFGVGSWADGKIALTSLVTLTSRLAS